MLEAHLTDDMEIAARLTAQTRAVLALADMITGNALERATALISAATTLIEREVGGAMASAALMALIEPTLAAWHADQSRAGRA